MKPSPEPMAAAGNQEGMSQRAASGARVLMIGQLSKVTLQFVSVAVLGRLLGPAAYGYFALALAVVSLGEVFRDFGLSSAAIQARTLSRGQQSNLVWINLALGCVLAVACAVLAPLVGSIGSYGPTVHLVQVLGLAFVLNGLLAQYRADLSRNLRFAALTVSEVAGQAIGVALAIAAAVAGAGYWALAVQQLAALGAASILTIKAAGWLPHRPDRSADVRPLMRFGMGMVGTQLVGYVNNNIDTFTVGLRFGPTALGVYNRAYQLLMQSLNQFRNPTTTLAVPLLSRLEAGGIQADRMVIRGQAALGYTLVAGTALAAGAAEPIIALALGAQWKGAVPLFAALACAGACQTVGYVNYWVFISRGLSGRLFWYSLISLSIRIVCVVAGSFWGLLGVAIGYAVAPAIALPIANTMLNRWTPVPTRALHWGALRILAIAAVAALSVRGVQTLLSDWSAVVQLLACGPTLVATYAAVALFVPAVRNDLRGVLQFTRMAMPGASRSGSRRGG